MNQNVLPPKKLEEQTVEKWENDHKNEIPTMFGEWFNNISALYEEFTSAAPFSNIVIHNFLSEEWAQKLENEFPEVGDSFHFYNNPLE